jgi:hypothetical protein
MDPNIIKYLNKIFIKIKTKYAFSDKMRNDILEEFYNSASFKNNPKNLLKYSEKKSENLIINCLSDFIIKKIYFNVINIRVKNDLCVYFMKIVEFIFLKFDNRTFTFYNMSNDQSISFIGSLMNNFTKIIQYVNDEFEINNSIINNKIEIIKYDEGKCIGDLDLKLDDNNITLIDCSAINSRNMCKLSKIISNVVISFGKKIFQSDEWKIYKINQYNISVYIHFNKSFYC